MLVDFTHVKNIFVGSEITFYPGINDDLLRRVLTELMKNVS